jgi:predicted nucleotidyltransferase
MPLLAVGCKFVRGNTSGARPPGLKSRNGRPRRGKFGWSRGSKIPAMLSPAFVEKLRSYPEIELAVLFGSEASGRSGVDSDVDVAVMAAAPLTADRKYSLVGDLAEISGRPVDLVDLRTAGEPVLGQILRHGKRLFGEDEAWARLLSRHLLDAADFMPHVERILSERRQRWIGR